MSLKTNLGVLLQKGPAPRENPPSHADLMLLLRSPALRASKRCKKVFDYSGDSLVMKSCACSAATALVKAEALPPVKKYVLKAEKQVKKRLATLFAAWAKKFAMEVSGKIAKGDVAGHAFHGNQWTDGEGLSEGQKALHAGADAIRAMSTHARDNTESQDMPGGHAAFLLYEAQQLAPKDTGDKLKRVTESNSFKMHEEQDYIANIEGTHYGVTKQEDPDEPDDDKKFVFAHTRIDSNTKDQGYGKLVTTSTSDPKELIAELRALHPKKARKADLRALLRKAAKTPEEIVDEILSDISFQGYATALIDTLRDDLVQAFKSGGLSGLDLIGMQNDRSIVNLVNDRAIDYARDRAAELVGMKYDSDSGKFVTNPNADYALQDTTRESLRRVLTDAVETGASTDEIASALTESYGFSEDRAATIARTELATAHVEGNLTAWTESGEVTGKESILADTHPQEDVCDENAAAGIIDLDAEFPSGDQGPPYHPNCLCDLSPVLSPDSSS